MKRLFQVRSAAGDPLRWDSEQDGDGVRYFGNKVDAKVARDEAAKLTGFPHHVTLGPDHWGRGWGA